MKLLALALAVGPIATGPGTPYFAGMPPERFQGASTVRVKLVDNPHAACLDPKDPPPEGMRILACARHDWLGTYIIMPMPGTYGERGEEFARLFAHEAAHSAFLWPANHPL